MRTWEHGQACTGTGKEQTWACVGMGMGFGEDDDRYESKLRD